MISALRILLLSGIWFAGTAAAACHPATPAVLDANILSGLDVTEAERSALATVRAAGPLWLRYSPSDTRYAFSHRLWRPDGSVRPDDTGVMIRRIEAEEAEFGVHVTLPPRGLGAALRMDRQGRILNTYDGDVWPDLAFFLLPTFPFEVMPGAPLPTKPTDFGLLRLIALEAEANSRPPEKAPRDVGDVPDICAYAIGETRLNDRPVAVVGARLEDDHPQGINVLGIAFLDLGTAALVSFVAVGHMALDGRRSRVFQFRFTDSAPR